MINLEAASRTQRKQRLPFQEAASAHPLVAHHPAHRYHPQQHPVPHQPQCTQWLPHRNRPAFHRAGNKDARTGDKETGLHKIFDAEKVQKEINAQVIITQAFGREAPKAAANFAQQQANDLRAQAKAAAEAGNINRARELSAEAQRWDEGGAYRVALHTALGGLSGGVQGALGAGAAASAAPLLDQLQENIAQTLKDAGAGDTVAKLAGQIIAQGTAAGIGSVASGGSTAGAAMGFNVDANIRACEDYRERDAFIEFHPAFPETGVRLDFTFNWQKPTEIASRIQSIMPPDTAVAFSAFGWDAVNIVVQGLVDLEERPNLMKLTRVSRTKGVSSTFYLTPAGYAASMQSSHAPAYAG